MSAQREDGWYWFRNGPELAALGLDRKWKCAEVVDGHAYSRGNIFKLGEQYEVGPRISMPDERPSPAPEPSVRHDAVSVAIDALQRLHPGLWCDECKSYAKECGCATTITERIAGRAIKALESLQPKPSPVSAKGWQDISTAPKDGTFVDLWIPKGAKGSRSHIANRVPDCAYVKGKWQLGGEFELPWLQDATYWMPLPAPPVEGKDGH